MWLDGSIDVVIILLRVAGCIIEPGSDGISANRGGWCNATNRVADIDILLHVAG